MEYGPKKPKAPVDTTALKERITDTYRKFTGGPNKPGTANTMKGLEAMQDTLETERAKVKDHTKKNSARHAHMAMDGSIAVSHSDACKTIHSQTEQSTRNMQHMMGNGLMDNDGDEGY